MLTQAQYELLVTFRSGLVFAPGPPAGVLKELVDRGYVISSKSRVAHESPSEVSFEVESWRLSIAGEDALSEFEQRHAEKAQAERQQRFQNQVSVAQVLVPAITFVFGLLVEHYSGVVGVLGRWIEYLVH